MMVLTKQKVSRRRHARRTFPNRQVQTLPAASPDYAEDVMKRLGTDQEVHGKPTKRDWMTICIVAVILVLFYMGAFKVFELQGVVVIGWPRLLALIGVAMLVIFAPRRIRGTFFRVMEYMFRR